VMSFALEHHQPALYKTVRQHTALTREVRAVLELNRQFAVTRGIVVPVKNVFGMVGLFALAFEGTDLQLADCWHQHGSGIMHRLHQLNLEILGRHARTFTRDFVPALSERQLQIIRLLARGLTSDELADELHLSIHTVNKHVASVKDQLSAKTAAQATAHAVKWGLI